MAEEITSEIDQLRERLAAAEDLCVMWSWTATDHSDRGKACHELWLRWMALSGNDSSSESNPHLTDELIAQLAAKRDATRRETLARMGADDDTPQRCPVHHMPDCSPLLNGCSRLTADGGA